MAVQIILKNSSIEDKRPQASQLTNGEISLNYNETGAFLCCTDSSGEVQQVGGVKIDETAPDAPVKQTLWFKPSTLTLSVYDGDKWLPIAGGGGGGTPGGGDIIQIIGNDGIDADTVAGIVTLDVELAGGDDGLEFQSSKLSATLASATDLGSVKVGDNINVTAGKISVPKATTSTFGVVKLGDGITIEGDGSISIDVPTTTTYRGSCDLNNPPTGQINPDPALKGDAYINSADAPVVDAGWTGITGSAKIGDLVIFDGAIWDLIPLGGEAPVTSVNGKTGDVVLDYTDVGAASEAQGELADTALQPGDNITELDNDAGYITAAEAPVQSVNGKTGVVVLDAADVGALAPGDDVSLLANDAEYISKGDPVSDLDNDAEYLSKGDDISELNNDVPYLVASDLPPFPDQEPPVIISDTPPTGTDAAEGNLWFNSNDGRTYVYYKDGDSSQWVDASPDSGGAGGTVGDYWLEAGGYLSPKTGTNGVDIGGSKIQLNTDGSITAETRVTADQFFSIGSGKYAFSTRPSGVGAPVTSYIMQDGDAAFGIEPDGSINIELNKDGSSEFAGDMAIGTTGSFTPSTPAISLNANGTVTAKSNITSNGYMQVVDEGLTSSITTTNQYITINTSSEYALRIRDSLDVNKENRIMLYQNGNITAVGDIQSTSQNGGQLAGFRNQIINGDFGVWQRGINFSLPLSSGQTNVYTADRFRSATDTTATVGRSTNTPAGFAFAITLSAGSNGLYQGIELRSDSSGNVQAGVFSVGSVWTYSIWSDVDLTSKRVLVRWADTAALSNPSTIETSTNFVAVAGSTNNGYTKYTSTVTINSSPANPQKCLVVYFGSVGVAAKYTGVQFEPGPVSTPFEHRPVGTELALCQRYYQKLKLYGAVVCMGNDADRTARTPQRLAVSMRATPTVQNLVKDDSAEAVEQNGTKYTKSAPSTVHANTNDSIEITNVTKAGQLSTVRYTAASVELEAEL